MSEKFLKKIWCIEVVLYLLLGVGKRQIEYSYITYAVEFENRRILWGGFGIAFVFYLLLGILIHYDKSRIRQRFLLGYILISAVGIIYCYTFTICGAGIWDALIRNIVYSIIYPAYIVAYLMVQYISIYIKISFFWQITVVNIFIMAPLALWVYSNLLKEKLVTYVMVAFSAWVLLLGFHIDGYYVIDSTIILLALLFMYAGWLILIMKNKADLKWIRIACIMCSAIICFTICNFLTAGSNNEVFQYINQFVSFSVIFQNPFYHFVNGEKLFFCTMGWMDFILITLSIKKVRVLLCHLTPGHKN